MPTPPLCRSLQEFQCPCKQKLAGFMNMPTKNHVRNSFAQKAGCSPAFFHTGCLVPKCLLYASCHFPRIFLLTSTSPGAAPAVPSPSAAELLPDKPLGPRSMCRNAAPASGCRSAQQMAGIAYCILLRGTSKPLRTAENTSTFFLLLLS